MELKFERESLYREVWESPITTLAKKYGLSDNGLRKVCATLAIPLPNRGHWAKVAAGHQLVTPALPPTEGPTSFACRLPDADEGRATGLQRDASLEDQLAFESAPQNAIAVPAGLIKPHRLVATAVPVIRAEIAGIQRSRERQANPRRRKPGERWEPDWEALRKPSWRDYELRGVMEFDGDALPVRVSVDAADRALRIWDALLKACEARGMRASAATRQVKVSDGIDDVGLRMSEKVDRITRPATWGGDETVRRIPTGRLRIFVAHLGETKFEDTPERPLEAQLNAILMWIRRSFATQRASRAIAAEKKRVDDAAAQARELKHAAEAAAARLREEEEARQQAAQAAAEAIRAQESERERLLLIEASAWRDAETIRAYAAHLMAAGAAIVPSFRDWLAWAETVADKLDPTSKRLPSGET